MRAAPWFSLIQLVWLVFFFQAEDGIRDWSVTGVQTCALPISQSHIGHKADLFFVLFVPWWCGARERSHDRRRPDVRDLGGRRVRRGDPGGAAEIGRASCRERV